jgi:hypothetical protein
VSFKLPLSFSPQKPPKYPNVLTPKKHFHLYSKSPSFNPSLPHSDFQFNKKPKLDSKIPSTSSDDGVLQGGVTIFSSLDDFIAARVAGFNMPPLPQ